MPPIRALDVIPHLARHPCPGFQPGFGAQGLCARVTNRVWEFCELRRRRKNLQVRRGVIEIRMLSTALFERRALASTLARKLLPSISTQISAAIRSVNRAIPCAISQRKGE